VHPTIAVAAIVFAADRCPAILVVLAIAHVATVAIAIALVIIACLPPSLPLLLPPSQLPSLSHAIHVADTIALFVALALFFTRHPYLSQTQIWLILNKMTKLKKTDLSIAN
jgi:hypothetical protein